MEIAIAVFFVPPAYCDSFDYIKLLIFKQKKIDSIIGAEFWRGSRLSLIC